MQMKCIGKHFVCLLTTVSIVQQGIREEKSINLNK